MTLRVHATDPGPLLEAAFRRIERDAMAGVPMLHPALRVQAVGFERRADGHWLGALVTPWFLNLMCVPGQDEGWTPAPPETRVFRRFPAAELAFLGGDEPEVGPFLTCSLFSPMGAFDGQAAAVATAHESLRLLHVAPEAAPDGSADATPDAATATATATATGTASPTGATSAARPPPRPARRAFLLGRRDPGRP